MGYFLLDVMGVGYDYIDKVLNGDVVAEIVNSARDSEDCGDGGMLTSGNAGGISRAHSFLSARQSASRSAASSNT